MSTELFILGHVILFSISYCSVFVILMADNSDGFSTTFFNSFLLALPLFGVFELIYWTLHWLFIYN